MNLSYYISLILISVTLSALCPCLYSQEKPDDHDYRPISGQDGKNVTWIPTPQPLIATMLSAANVTSDDFVIDLGSGDGRGVITAAKRGARGRGIEDNPELVIYSRRMAEREGVADRVEFYQGDLFNADLSEATVIIMFLLPSLNIRLAPHFMKLKPGTRIVSNSFGMGDWIPDDTARSPKPCRTYCDALLWIVPAKVEGTWLLPEGEVTFHQKYQNLTGSLTTGGRKTAIYGGRLRGDQITFYADFKKYCGYVKGNSIEGTVLSGLKHGFWTAQKQ